MIKVTRNKKKIFEKNQQLKIVLLIYENYNKMFSWKKYRRDPAHNVQGLTKVSGFLRICVSMREIFKKNLGKSVEMQIAAKASLILQHDVGTP